MTKRDFDVVYPEETLQEFETGLGMTFSNKVYTEGRTVGELFDDVWNEMAPLVSGGGRCPTTAGFNHVRRAIREQCPHKTITPTTALSDIEGFEYIKLQATLRRMGWSSPLRYPRSNAGAYIDAWLPHVVMLAAMGAACAIRSIWSKPLPWALTIVLAIGLGILAFFAGAWLRHTYLFPKGQPAAETVGGLAHAVTRLNLKRLRAEGATGLNRTIVWRLLFGTEPIDRSPIFIWDF